jgi:enterochelin esterase-like enzyme
MNMDMLLTEEPLVTSPIYRDKEVLFHYNGKADTVFLAGDYNRWELKDRMRKLQDRDVWSITKKFPPNARFDYKYIVDNNWIIDPLNQHTTPGGSGLNSTLIMPKYRSRYEDIIHQDVPRGTVIHNLEYYSQHLHTNMRYHIYLPLDYAKGRVNHILYALDGSDYLNLSQVNLVFDYMMHMEEMPSAVVVLVDPHERTKEYTLYEPYYNYVIQELMPFIENEYMNPDAGYERAAMGVSWGGLTAIYLAVNPPGLFHRVLSQSGSFWPKDWQILDMVANSIVSGISFCLQTGTIEDTEEMNDAMVEILKEKGCLVNYMKYAESHSWGNWKGHLDEGLKALYMQM